MTRNVRFILDHYCKVSSQIVNFHKFIQFSKGTSNVDKTEIEQILQKKKNHKLDRSKLGYEHRKEKESFMRLNDKRERNWWVGKLEHYHLQIRSLLKSNLTCVPQFLKIGINFLNIPIKK